MTNLLHVILSTKKDIKQMKRISNYKLISVCNFTRNMSQ